MERQLAGRVAWVTGGASGMGRASALALAQLGADVAIGSLVRSQRAVVIPRQNVYTPEDEDLDRTKTEIEALGVRGMAMPLDVCSDRSVRNVCSSSAFWLWSQAGGSRRRRACWQPRLLRRCRSISTPTGRCFRC